MKKIFLIIFFISFKIFSQENVEMPVFPNCEQNDNPKDCFLTSIAEQLVKDTDFLLANDYDEENYLENIEETENPNETDTEKVMCYFTIDYQGKTKKVRIQGNINRDTRKKFRDNLKELPIMKPGTLNGEPVDIPFALPVFVVLY
ncbi:hypothetical protein [Snuella lapsa]|uniref:TonB C-terminal domain-containing protein n=1 Tax=Snuella lapsa TaxID=870481 RepID=A0ABP6YBU5_9FLAO